MKAATHLCGKSNSIEGRTQSGKHTDFAKERAWHCTHLQTRVYPESCRRCPHLQEAQVQRV